VAAELLQQWVLQRAERWKQISQLQKSVEKGRYASMDEVLDTTHAYREIAHDYTLAQQQLPGTRIAKQLQGVYAGLHQSIYRRRDRLLQNIGNLFKREAPQIFAELGPYIFWVTVLFLGSAFAGWLLVTAFPELAALFASEEMIESVQNGELWTDGLLNVMPSSILALNILTNNIVVSLTAFCLGLLFGLGTVYIISLNGLMLGGVFAFTAQHSMAGRLFEFIVAHGVVELSAICISGAVGLSIGEALVRPGKLSRRAAFEYASRRGLKLMAVIVVFLFGAGIIEGYVSPDPAFPLWSRICIGCGYMLLFVYVIAVPRGLALRPGGAHASADK
jgi:uncharacterized membrane protein SpoIIM required for sporulation